mmetsp:Transcript_16245/g.23513  ORF Transcript_16245/g.23513 Transcript_16245/m.23513 type:complete len:235 (+) Transcript_16245:45-749(+)
MQNPTYQTNLLDLEEEQKMPDHFVKERSEYFDQPVTTQEEQNPKFWELAYYRPFFDVNTAKVLERMKLSVVPFGSDSFFGVDRPDLYGPFWIACTVTFLLFAVGSIETNYSGFSGHFTAFTSGSVIVFGTLVVTPLILYFILNNSGSEVTYFYLISLFGYSLSGFGIGILCCIYTNRFWRWSITTAAGVWSGVSLFMNLNKEFDLGKTKWPVMVSLMLAEGVLVFATNYFVSID